MRKTVTGTRPWKSIVWNSFFENASFLHTYLTITLLVMCIMPCVNSYSILLGSSMSQVLPSSVANLVCFPFTVNLCRKSYRYYSAPVMCPEQITVFPRSWKHKWKFPSRKNLLRAVFPIYLFVFFLNYITYDNISITL